MDNTAAESGAVNLHYSTGCFERCLFTGNAASFGAAMWASKVSYAFISGCTLWGNLSPSSAVIVCTEREITLDNTIIAFNGDCAAVLGGSSMTLSCCNLYGNGGGDWVDGIEDQYGVRGNISEDPIFCDPEGGDLTLRSDSPCAPFTTPNEDCDLIGALPVGCDPPTASRASTWGRIKAGKR
jgi:hypothetical protein